MLTGKLNLRNFVKMAWPERAEEVVDVFNLQEIEEEKTMCMEASSSAGSSTHGSIILECFNSIREIGVACSAECPRERMKVNDAESRLCLFEKKLHEASACHEDEQTTMLALIIYNPFHHIAIIGAKLFVATFIKCHHFKFEKFSFHMFLFLFYFLFLGG